MKKIIGSETAEKRFYATGRRKCSVARVWMRQGTGLIRVNERPFEEFFGRESLRMIVAQPLGIVEQAGKFDININVAGGGSSGQAGAIRHGIAKALTLVDPAFRTRLKKAGFITRDAREVERKKYGRPGARKRFQFSKR